MRLMGSAWDEISLPAVVNAGWGVKEHVDCVNRIANGTECSHLQSPVVNEAQAVQLASGYEMVHLPLLASMPLIYLVNDAEGTDNSRLKNALTEADNSYFVRYSRRDIMWRFRRFRSIIVIIWQWWRSPVPNWSRCTQGRRFFQMLFERALERAQDIPNCL